MKKNDAIYVSKVKAYRTPSPEAKGAYSIGVSLADRLNGDEFLVSYNPEDTTPRKLSFVTAIEKFGSNEDFVIKGDNEEYTPEELEINRKAREEVMAELKPYLATIKKKYPRGSKLDARFWKWGAVDEDGTAVYDEDHITVHRLVFSKDGFEKEVKPDVETVNAAKKDQESKSSTQTLSK